MADLDQARPIFHAALGLDADKRPQYLDVACQDDDQLRQMVESLLVAHGNAGQFMEGAALTADDVIGSEEFLSSRQIGRYKLLQKIGEGGFGVVYMAEQQEPVIRRVALKIIKPGMDTKQVIARFEAERQALALMEHPNIAQAFDAGETEDARPYFVMELVRGISVIQFCDEQKITYESRLEVFRDICHAVQHAHQKGIIHRDLKPSNILVTMQNGEPVPKVIDFGIAKATQQRLTEKTLFTRFEQFVGTPAYMSPEQAQMSSIDVDTRSDIYSLGVLLYELLTGTTPLDPNRAIQIGFEELCRCIREEEVESPSKRVSSMELERRTSVASNRGLDADAFQARLRGDLDWIVMKAVDKDLRRRYESASALATDVERYLQQEPVSAVPPSRTYLLRKFVRRNQVAVFMTAAVAAAVLLGALLAMVGWFQAVAARQEAVATADQLTSQVSKTQDALRKADVETERALSAKRTAQQIAYVSALRAAHLAMANHNLGFARQILVETRPHADEIDLRHWEWRALWAICQDRAVSSFRMTEDYLNLISSMSISSDGRWLALGLHERLSIWDLETEKQLYTSEGTGEQLSHCHVAFSPQENRLYFSDVNNSIRSLQIPSLEESEQIFRCGGDVEDLAISPDGKWLATYNSNGDALLWDRLEGKEVKRWTNADAHLAGRVVEFSPDSSLLVIGDQSIRVVDLNSYKIHMIDAECRKRGLEFTPDGKMIAVATYAPDYNILLYRVSDGQLMAELPGHRLEINDFAISPEGDLLASASADQSVRLWDIPSGRQVAVLQQHTDEVHVVAFAPDGETLYSGCIDGQLCVWNAQAEKGSHWPLRVPEAAHYDKVKDTYYKQFSQTSFSRDGALIASRNMQRELTFRSVDNLEVVSTFDTLDVDIQGVRFSPTRDLLAVGTTVGSVALVGVDAVSQIRWVTVSENAQVFPIGFSSDGGRLLVVAKGPAENICLVFRCGDSTLQQITSWECGPRAISAALSPDGETVITGHEGEPGIRIWSLSEIGRQTDLGEAEYLGIDFSPDSQFALVARGDGLIQVIDVDKREIAGQLVGHMQGCHSVKFSPDGRRVASGGHTSESVKVWDFITRRELMTLITPGFSFRQVEWSPDGNAILALGGPGDLNLWRVPSLEEIEDAESKMAVRSP